MIQAALILSLVVAVEGNNFRVDKGLVDGLRVGDRGRLFYTLTVDSRKVRIEVGEAEIIRTEDLESLARPIGPVPVLTGYQLEVTASPDQPSPTELLKIANQRLAEGSLSAALAYFRRLDEIMAGDPLVNRRIREIESRLQSQAIPPSTENRQLEYYRIAARASWDEGDLQAVGDYLEKILAVESDDPLALDLQRAVRLRRRQESMINIGSGNYTIGVGLGSARFFNQQPEFSMELSTYWIDRLPAGEGDVALTGLTYAEAENRCRSLGKRLPSEFEWEIAAQHPDFRFLEGVSEWTSSWYRPYPGNNRNEPEYGDKFKVVRGFGGNGEFQPKMRFFMAPDDKARDVGFRCVVEGE